MSDPLRVCVDGAEQLAPRYFRRLVDWLRVDLGIHAVKDACSAGDCGACSVLVDGTLELACCVLTATVGGTTISTAASVANDDPIVTLMRDSGAAQCGFCSPGIAMAARFAGRELDRGGPKPDFVVLARAALAGNICRCTGYVPIIDAVSRYLQQTWFEPLVQSELRGPTLLINNSAIGVNKPDITTSRNCTE